MSNRDGRFKKWIRNNKAAVISLAVVLVYTMIMLGIIFGSGYSFSKCSSGSLTDVQNQEVEIQTSMHRPEN